MGALGHDRAQHCGPSWYPCHNLYLVMSFCNTTRRVYHWAQGQQIVAKQHVMGRLYGASHMAISYPELSLVCGSGLKQKTKGNASGEPKIQMQFPSCSTAGVTASSTVATLRKRGFNPHPFVQKLQQFASTILLTKFVTSLRFRTMIA